MKIEMADSLVYSWLRHEKKCQMVQTNWKIAQEWTLFNESDLNDLQEKLQKRFEEKYQYKVFRQNLTLQQLIGQGENDAVGAAVTEKGICYYGIDIGYQEGGLSYGTKEETVCRILARITRMAICMSGYLKAVKAELYFASPRISNSVIGSLTPCIEDMNQILHDEGYTFEVHILANELFFEEVMKPIITMNESSADSAELFLKSCQMMNQYIEFKAVKEEQEKQKEADSVPVVPQVTAAEGKKIMPLLDEADYTVPVQTEPVSEKTKLPSYGKRLLPVPEERASVPLVEQLSIRKGGGAAGEIEESISVFGEKTLHLFGKKSDKKSDMVAKEKDSEALSDEIEKKKTRDSSVMPVPESSMPEPVQLAKTRLFDPNFVEPAKTKLFDPELLGEKRTKLFDPADVKEEKTEHRKDSMFDEESIKSAEVGLFDTKPAKKPAAEPAVKSVEESAAESAVKSVVDSAMEPAVEISSQELDKPLFSHKPMQAVKESDKELAKKQEIEPEKELQKESGPFIVRLKPSVEPSAQNGNKSLIHAPEDSKNESLIHTPEDIKNESLIHAPEKGKSESLIHVPTPPDPDAGFLGIKPLISEEKPAIGLGLGSGSVQKPQSVIVKKANTEFYEPGFDGTKGQDVQPSKMQYRESLITGYQNRHQQMNMGFSGREGTVVGQRSYFMRCRVCGYEYESDGCDIWQKRCPNCMKSLRSNE